MSTPATVTFLDETSLNPLPAGLLATIFSGANIVGKAYLLAGGVATFANVQPNSTYTAVFSGAISQAPLASAICTFTTPTSGSTTAIVLGYVSSTLSTAGYAAAQTSLYPLDRFSPAALLPGGVAYAQAYGLAALLAQLDLQSQTTRAALRLQSCQGGEIDSWAYDFLGTFFSRCPIDTDASWYNEILAILQTPKTTVAGLQNILNVFLKCILFNFTPKTIADDTQGSVDNSGGVDVVPNSMPVTPTIPIGADSYGGVDAVGYDDAPTPALQAPAVIVFDSQSDPALSTTISPHIVPGQFCVYLTYPGYADAGIHPISPITPLLAQIVNLWRASGVQPIYATNLTS